MGDDMGSMTLQGKLDLKEERKKLEDRISEIDSILESAESIDIFSAIQTKDEALIKQWLDDESSDPNTINKDGLSPFLFAISYASQKKLNLSLTDIKHYSETQNSLLSSLPILILNKGFNLSMFDFKENDDDTYALEFQTTKMKEFLCGYWASDADAFSFFIDALSKKGLIDTKSLNSAGKNILMESMALRGRYQPDSSHALLRAFLEHGGDINSQDDKGMTAAMYASKDFISLKGFIEESSLDFNKTDNSGKNLLQHALSFMVDFYHPDNKELKEAVVCLLDNTSPVNLLKTRGEFQDILIQLPGDILKVIAEHPAFGKSLLEQTYTGVSFIKKHGYHDDGCYAVKSREESVIDIIIEERAKGIDVDITFHMEEILKIDPSYANRQNSIGETLIMHMAKHRDIKKTPFRKLLKLYPSIDINAQDVEGRTAIHHAMEGGNLDATQALLDYSSYCDVNKSSNSDGHNLVMAAIKASESSYKKPIKNGFIRMAYKLVERFEANGLDFSHLDSNGRPLIAHFSNDGGYTSPEERALGRVIDICVQNHSFGLNHSFSEGMTLLHYLANSRLDLHILKLLESYPSTDDLNTSIANDKGLPVNRYAKESSSIRLKGKTLEALDERVILDAEQLSSSERESGIADIMGLR